MKSSVSELALFGGTPEFDEKLFVGRPNLGNRERLFERLNDMLDRRWLTNHGPFVIEFEEKIAKFLGVKHCIAMCNATVGLEIAVRALGMSGEVIVPSFTFIATVHALQWQGITPVFADIDPKTHLLDPAAVEKMITPRTTGIIGVHLWGEPCNIEDLTEIARRRRLKLIFDAAHAFGCSHGNQMIGNFGDAEVFSFHATKFFNTFEGGAVVTNNDDLARKIRLMQNFGFTGFDKVDFIGTNGKMSEASAAMGLTSLESLEVFLETNRRNYFLYRDGLLGLPGIRFLEYSHDSKKNFQYVVIEVDRMESKLSRDQLRDILWAENVIVRRYFYPGCHRMEPYISYYPYAGSFLPATEDITQKVLILPTGTTIGKEEISKICNIIKLSISQADAINQKISQETKE